MRLVLSHKYGSVPIKYKKKQISICLQTSFYAVHNIDLTNLQSMTEKQARENIKEKGYE